MTAAKDIYAGRDPRDVPAYSLAEAAGYLRLPPTTLRQWVLGQKYRTSSGERRTPAVIPIADAGSSTLSFWNLAEAHVLAAIRRQHGVSLQSVRRALSYVAKVMHDKRPLLGRDFLTDGVSLFVDRLESYADQDAGVRSLVNASKDGQLAARALLQGALDRVDRDPAGLIDRIFPWVKDLKEPKRVEIDPRRAFGRPLVAGTRVPAEELSERFAAGDPVEDIAQDFRLIARWWRACCSGRWQGSRMPRQREPPVFFIDHCLGTEKVAGRLREAGAAVRVLVDEGFGEARRTSSGCPLWLRSLGRC